MPDQSAESAVPEQPKKKRGPKSRAEIEAEIRAEVEAEVRAQVAAEAAEAEAAEKAAREEAADARPLPASQIDGDPSAPGAVIIHFVDDGFTKLGRVWLRGEHLTLNPGSPQWEESLDANGRCFATLDEDEQIAKWGRRFFRQGVWRGMRLDQIEDPELTEEERVALKKAQAEFDAKYGVVAGG